MQKKQTGCSHLGRGGNTLASQPGLDFFSKKDLSDQANLTMSALSRVFPFAGFCLFSLFLFFAHFYRENLHYDRLATAIAPSLNPQHSSLDNTPPSAPKGALVRRYWKLCQNPTPRLGRRNLSSGTQSDPTISPINIDHIDHDYYFELPHLVRERGAQSMRRRFTSHHGRLRAAPRANRTVRIVDRSIPCATSRTDRHRACAPWPLSRCVVPDEALSGNIVVANRG